MRRITGFTTPGQAGEENKYRVKACIPFDYKQVQCGDQDSCTHSPGLTDLQRTLHTKVTDKARGGLAREKVTVVRGEPLQV